MANVTVNHC